MATVPFSMPGQQNMPGNAAPTQGLNYSFLPGARSGGATRQDGTGGANTFSGIMPGQYPINAGSGSSSGMLTDPGYAVNYMQDPVYRASLGITSPPSPPTGNTGNPNTGQVPIPYTANNYQSASNVNNPFANYTGFNLGLNSASELNSMFGPLGDAMYYYLNNGAGYNPAVLNSLINQIQPQVQEGIATLGSTAGMTGNRFGSAYQLGTADYLSQVNQNELAMGSQLYQHSQDTINEDMMKMLPYAATWKNNQGGFLQNLIGALIPTLGNIPGITPSPRPTPGPKPPGPALPPGVQKTFPGQPSTGGQTLPQPGQVDPGAISSGMLPYSGEQSTFNQQKFDSALQSYQQALANGDSATAQQALQAMMANMGGTEYVGDPGTTGSWQVPTDNSGLQLPSGFDQIPNTGTADPTNLWGGIDWNSIINNMSGNNAAPPTQIDPYAGQGPMSDLTNFGDFGGWGGGGDFGGEAYYG